AIRPPRPQPPPRPSRLFDHKGRRHAEGEVAAFSPPPWSSSPVPLTITDEEPRKTAPPHAGRGRYGSTQTHLRLLQPPVSHASLDLLPDSTAAVIQPNLQRAHCRPAPSPSTSARELLPRALSTTNADLLLPKAAAQTRLDHQAHHTTHNHQRGQIRSHQQSSSSELPLSYH
ncbi:hypothetical protein Dimus_015829, partial [Dionaea muscipula]